MPGTDTDWVESFFVHHLGTRCGQALLPGLQSLSTAFTIDVDGHGTFAIEVERGVLTRSERAARSPRSHACVAPEDFRAVVEGRVTPQSLFVRRRLRIHGNPLHVLRAAPAMEEYFRKHPFSSPQASSPR